MFDWPRQVTDEAFRVRGTYDVTGGSGDSLLALRSPWSNNPGVPHPSSLALNPSLSVDPWVTLQGRQRARHTNVTFNRDSIGLGSR